jgi:homogentisate 1,2-dioxygenase
MQVVKGIYKNGKIELLESLGEIRSAELYIVVIPRGQDKVKYGAA